MMKKFFILPVFILILFSIIFPSFKADASTLCCFGGGPTECGGVGTCGDGNTSCSVGGVSGGTCWDTVVLPKNDKGFFMNWVNAVKVRFASLPAVTGGVMVEKRETQMREEKVSLKLSVNTTTGATKYKFKIYDKEGKLFKEYNLNNPYLNLNEEILKSFSPSEKYSFTVSAGNSVGFSVPTASKEFSVKTRMVQIPPSYFSGVADRFGLVGVVNNKAKKDGSPKTPVLLILTKISTPGGTGLVKSSPNGINCDTLCQSQSNTFSYPSPTLEAYEDPGSQFIGWQVQEGGSFISVSTCTTAATPSLSSPICVVTPTPGSPGGMEVFAHFAPILTTGNGPNILTVSKIGSGGGTVNGIYPVPPTITQNISCDPICTANFPQSPNQYTALLEAIPNSSSNFMGWSGNCTPVATNPNQCKVFMNTTKTVTAQFDLGPTLTITKSGTGNGTVKDNPLSGINCASGLSSDCIESYSISTPSKIVTLVAQPSIGSKFNGWSGGGCSGTGSCQVTMDMDKTINSQFNKSIAFIDSNNIISVTESKPCVNDTWTQKADFGGAARVGSAAFSIGNKGYVGGGTISANVFSDGFWEYTPGSGLMGGTWIQKASLNVPRNQPAAFSISNMGYLGLGWTNYIYSGGAPYSPTKEFWRYDPSVNTWTQIPAMSSTQTGGAYTVGGLYNKISFSIGNKGYIGSGHLAAGADPTKVAHKKFDEYDQQNNTWTQKGDFIGGIEAGAVGFSIGNKGYIVKKISGSTIRKIMYGLKELILEEPLDSRLLVFRLIIKVTLE
ncbi:MAG: Kelch repeat type 1-containing protein [Candidatus Nomurabacteria bacterium GW2011_GWB1_37_5]|uniref:Kelch repeat type 1-containing protein n=1 Tax=Candidatus Nomurabacteria bacterium GW2011_GWB1_37_5 TaxID=1618742 RepID=A0A0G0GSY4_9BACT|nr:MAG: Kelch repeat type 1-containing protein [Candidatus Nomurabacteria bacterium GW2011_GWB1_37_5]